MTATTRRALLLLTGAAALLAANDTCYDAGTFGRAWGGNVGTRMRADYTDGLLPLARCDAARRVAGGAERRARFRRKLADCSRPLVVVALGGSVSCGRNLGKGWKPPRADSLCFNSSTEYECKEEAFPALLGAALTARRLARCGAAPAPVVSVVNLCKSQCGSNYFVHELAAADAPDVVHRADLVLVETSTNDVYETLHEKFGEVQSAELQIQGWTELLARRLLALPSAPELVWVGAAWREWDERAIRARGGPPFIYHACAVEAHARVLRHYGIEQLAMVYAVGDLAVEATRAWLAKVYFNDQFHPTPLGHAMTASVLEYHLVDATNNTSGSASDDDPPALPPLLVVSDSQARVYAASAFSRVELRDAAAAAPYLSSSDGFGVAEDVKGKPGFIANDVGNSATIRLPRLDRSSPTAGANPGVVVVIGFLTSYEHMGCFRAVVAPCGGGSPIAEARIDGLTAARVSVYETATLEGALPASGDECLELSVVVVDAGRTANKVKLLDVSVSATEIAPAPPAIQRETIDDSPRQTTDAQIPKRVDSTLSAHALEAGIIHDGSARLERLRANLAARRPIRIVALGASITAGQGAKLSSRYDNVLAAMLNFHVRPTVGNHTAVNLGFHGADMCTIAPVTSSLLIPQLTDIGADLVIIELALNDDWLKESEGGALKLAKCTEAVVRQVLQSDGDVAVIFLDIISGRAPVSDRDEILKQVATARESDAYSCNASSSWPPLFGAADVHHRVACVYGLGHLCMVTALAAELSDATMPVLDECVKHKTYGDDESCGLFSGVHLADFAHETAASLAFYALTRTTTSAVVARPFPPSPIFMSEAELLADFAAVFVSDNDYLIDEVVIAQCPPNVKRTPQHEFVLKNHELPVAACEKGEPVSCDGGWVGPRGFVLNAMHTTQSPKHAGLHFIGKPCGQRVSLDFRIPNATRAVHGGYRVRLMFLHSYEHFGNFTTRLEVAETGLVKHKRLSGAWTSRTSVPSPEVIATLPVSAKGRRLRLSITAPWKGASGDSKIAITGLRVLELGR